MKVTIVEERKYDFVGKEGEKVSGYSYGGFCEDDTTITFTSQKQLPVVESHRFDPKKAVDLPIKPRIWGNTVKYRLQG